MKTHLLKNYIIALCAFSVMIAWYSNQNESHAAIDKKTVAIVNGSKISELEFKRRYADNIKYFRFSPPTKKNVLDDIIKFELGVQEAKKLGLDKRPKIKERMNSVLYQALVEEELSKKFNKIEVSDKEVNRFCSRYPQIRTSHVYVPLGMSALKSTEKNAYKKINAAQAALKTGQKFESVVAQFSEGYAANSGGDIGFQLKDKLDPAYYNAAIKLRIGSITKKPIRSQFGLHIIKLTEKRSCKDINVVEWKRMIFDEKRTKIFNEYLGKLRAKAKIEINKSLLEE